MSKHAHRVSVTLEIEVSDGRLSATTRRLVALLNEALAGESVTYFAIDSSECLAPDESSPFADTTTAPLTWPMPNASVAPSPIFDPCAQCRLGQCLYTACPKALRT